MQAFLPPAQALIECLLQELFVPAGPNEGSESKLLASRTEVQRNERTRAGISTAMSAAPVNHTDEEPHHLSSGDDRNEHHPISTGPRYNAERKAAGANAAVRDLRRLNSNPSSTRNPCKAQESI